jgi:23S rRNA (adenine2030-N6)-methyltransferase
MNYRHAFHAGNFADVIKHVALVSILLHLRRKQKGFCVIDTHAGSGVYDLAGAEAVRTGEAAEGIGRIIAIDNAPLQPEALKTYLRCVKGEGEAHYPGSARIAAGLLRPQDRLVAIEKHPAAVKALRTSLAQFPNARAVEANGYEQLPALVPPHERRGVILIDPPYEADDEFARVADILLRAYQRFATGIYVAWYPIKSRAAVDALYGEVSTNGITAVTRLEIEIRRLPDAGRERLLSAGLLIINPPFGFDEEMRGAAVVLAPLLGGGTREPASITVVSASA